jgi:CheY-like chemotaxis protein
MLDLNRIARGKLELQFAPVDLHAEVRHAMQTVEEDAASKQLVMSFDADAAHAEVVGDAARLQQVLWNVLKNAVKFTPPGGSVSVRTYNTKPDRVCIEVRDTGPGIEPELVDRIFNAFEQGGAQVTRQFGGLGLGLAISKVLTEMHGGKLTARSDGKGLGATFTLDLELAAIPEASAEARGAAGAPAPNASASKREEPTRILLVEDHKDTAHLMKRLLGGIGYDVQIAGTVAAALSADEARTFDLVISDLGLPDGSGYDLMRQLTARHPTKGIALSGYGMEEDVKQGVEAGFAAHLTKPINLEQLELTIQRVVGRVSRIAGNDRRHTRSRD